MFCKLSQQLNLSLVAVRLALLSLGREIPGSVFLRSLGVASAYALCAFLISDGNLKHAAWSTCVALLGISALSLVGLALPLRKRREAIGSLLASMPVPPCLWTSADAAALVVLTLSLSLPFLVIMRLVGALLTGAAIVLAISQSVLVILLFPLGISSKAGAVAWSVIIVVIWAQMLDVIKPLFYG